MSDSEEKSLSLRDKQLRALELVIEEDWNAREQLRSTAPEGYLSDRKSVVMWDGDQETLWDEPLASDLEVSEGLCSASHRYEMVPIQEWQIPRRRDCLRERVPACVCSKMPGMGVCECSRILEEWVKVFEERGITFTPSHPNGLEQLRLMMFSQSWNILKETSKEKYDLWEPALALLLLIQGRASYSMHVLAESSFHMKPLDAFYWAFCALRHPEVVLACAVISDTMELLSQRTHWLKKNNYQDPFLPVIQGGISARDMEFVLCLSLYGSDIVDAFQDAVVPDLLTRVVTRDLVDDYENDYMSSFALPVEIGPEKMYYHWQIVSGRRLRFRDRRSMVAHPFPVSARLVKGEGKSYQLYTLNKAFCGGYVLCLYVVEGTGYLLRAIVFQGQRGLEWWTSGGRGRVASIPTEMRWDWTSFVDPALFHGIRVAGMRVELPTPMPLVSVSYVGTGRVKNVTVLAQMPPLLLLTDKVEDVVPFWGAAEGVYRGAVPVFPVHVDEKVRHGYIKNSSTYIGSKPLEYGLPKMVEFEGKKCLVTGIPRTFLVAQPEFFKPYAYWVNPTLPSLGPRTGMAFDVLLPEMYDVPPCYDEANFYCCSLVDLPPIPKGELTISDDTFSGFDGGLRVGISDLKIAIPEEFEMVGINRVRVTHYSELPEVRMSSDFPPGERGKRHISIVDSIIDCRNKRKKNFRTVDRLDFLHVYNSSQGERRYEGFFRGRIKRKE